MLGLIAGLVVAGLFGYRAVQVNLDARPPLTVKRPELIALGLGLALFAMAFANRCIVAVPAAHVATLYDPLRGGVQPVELREGIHLVLPWWQTSLFRVQTQAYTMSQIHTEGVVHGDDSILCQTNEGLGLKLDITILFHIDPRDAHDLWRKVGENYKGIIVRPFARNVIRMVVAGYSVIDVYGARRHEIEQQISERMSSAFQEKGIVLEGVLLRNVEFANPEFAAAITAKQVAQQQIQTEIQKLRRAQYEKETTIAQARGEAEAIRRRAETLRAYPAVIQYEMAQKLAPNVRSLYLPPSMLPMTPLKGGR